jgi:hypothetical protein
LVIIILAAIVPDFDSGIGECRAMSGLCYVVLIEGRFNECRNRVSLCSRRAVRYHNREDQQPHVQVCISALLSSLVFTFFSWSIFLLGEKIASQVMSSSLTGGRDRMGCHLRSDAHSSLWSLTSPLLVSSAREILKCPIIAYHFYRFSLSGSSLAAHSHLI